MGCSSDVSDVTSGFVALVKINGDNSAASETSALSRTISELLLSVLTNGRPSSLTSRCCRLWIQPGLFAGFKALWPPEEAQTEFALNRSRVKHEGDPARCKADTFRLSLI